VRDFVGTVGRMIERADPDRVTMAWKIANRTGKVFIDHNMNRSGANIAAAYSLRPEPRATVSTPLRWNEVEAGVTPQDFRIDNVWTRFEEVGDLFEGVRTKPQDLTSALEALGLPSEKALGAPPKEPSKASSKKEPAKRKEPAKASSKKPRRTSEEVIAASKDPNLAEYLRKRTFGPEGTTEPPPGSASGQGNSFVIHKHRATRLHYDLRLEKDGALPSWAVPRGLPTVPGDKRLAVQTGFTPSSTASSTARSRKGTTAPARCVSSTTAGTRHWSGPTRR
jgi:bifunctional non-homologous end joining protein LigD